MAPPRLPARWTPKPPPALRGPYEQNLRLRAAELWPTPGGHGPEDVVLDRQGRLYAGLEDGRILRWAAPSAAPSVVADTGGRPLGLEFDPEGRLVVCDAVRGLLRVEPDAANGRGLETLVDSFEGRRLSFTNNASISAGGVIYFTESSTRYNVDRYRDDLLEHRPYGNLFAFDPASGHIELLLGGLYFANGVALAEDESFLLVAETSAYSLRRYWLRGERRGTHEVLVDNMPGFPDNLSRGKNGVFWAALPSVRNAALDALLPHPYARAAVSALPPWLQPQPRRYGLIVGVSAEGEVVHALHDPTGRVAEVTGVREHEGWLYFGSLTEPFVGRVRAPA